MHARYLVFLKRDFPKKGKRSIELPLRSPYVVFLERSSFLTFLLYFASMFSDIRGKEMENDSRNNVAVAAKDSWQVSRKSYENQRACESATSLKINSVKEPTDIRGLREDFTLQTRFLIFSCSISLCLIRCSFRLSIIRTRFSRLSRKCYLDFPHFSLPLSLY